jgi:cellulose biosynthesis protein BcsQ
LLKPLAEDYDFVFLDCPPNISLLSEAVFEAADILLSPIIPTTLSLRTLEQLKIFIEDNKLCNLRLIPFFSMADRRKNMHKDIMSELIKVYPEILNAVIPYASDIERMGLERMPLGGFINKSRSMDAYNELWIELMEQLKNE